MGNKYSTVYEHNTEANYQTNLSDVSSIHKISGALGSKCIIFESYKLRQRCKLCYETMYQKQVILLECGEFRHRYHTGCLESFIKFSNRKDVFKCEGCRNILNLYNISTISSHTQEGVI